MSFLKSFSFLILLVQLTLSRRKDHDSHLFTYSSICLDLQSLILSNIDWDSFFAGDTTARVVLSAFTNSGPESHRALFFPINDSPDLNGSQPMTVSFHNQFSSVGCWIKRTESNHPMINDVYLSLTVYETEHIQLQTQITIDLNGDTSANIWRTTDMNTVQTSKYSTANAQISVKFEKRKGLSEREKNEMSSLTMTAIIDESSDDVNDYMIIGESNDEPTYSWMMIAASISSFVGILVLFAVLIWAWKQYTRMEYKTIPTYNNNPRNGILRKISLRSAVEKHWKQKKKKNIMKPSLDLSSVLNTCHTPLQK